MKERTTTVYTCELCGFSSEDRVRVAACEAQGVPDAPSPDRIGYIRRIEKEHPRWGEERHEWLVQVRVVSSEADRHCRHCVVEVVPWPADEEDNFAYRSVLTVTGDAPETFLLDEIMFDREEAERSLYS